MADPMDGEILQLISKLNKIQEEVGTVDGDKKKKGGAGKAGGDRFMDLKLQMGDKLAEIHESVQEAQRLEKLPGNNPRDLITVQSKIREDVSALNEDWKELEGLYRAEAKKRKSKLSATELLARQKMVTELQQEIQGKDPFSLKTSRNI